MMGNGILVVVVWDDSMVVDNWVVDSMAVDGVYHLLFGLFNNLGIFVSLLGDFDGVSLFWNALLGHTFGVMGSTYLTTGTTGFTTGTAGTPQ